MRLSREVTGLSEKREALQKFRDELPTETAVGLTAGLQPIVGAMKLYPPQPPYMGMRGYGTGPIRTYVRTNNYGQRISQPVITRAADATIGTITSGADYSRWLRGTPEGDYLGAWMHRPFWRSLVDILKQYVPRAIEQVDAQINRLIARLGLGD